MSNTLRGPSCLTLGSSTEHTGIPMACPSSYSARGDGPEAMASR